MKSCPYTHTSYTPNNDGKITVVSIDATSRILILDKSYACNALRPSLIEWAGLMVFPGWIMTSTGDSLRPSSLLHAASVAYVGGA